jgi:hypothetical protein
MTVISRIRNGLVLLSPGAALILLIGCNADLSTSRTEPDGASTTRRFKQVEKDVEKDLKPPVIIKPDRDPATGAEQGQPKRD